MKLSSGPNSELIRVLVADSNQIQSELMCSALRRHTRLRVSSCRAELSNCLHELRVARADVMLIADTVTGARERYDMLRAIRSTHPHMSLILLLGKYDRNLVVNALRCGARGLFCSIDQPFKALRRCIEAVHQGQVWANNEQIRYLIDSLTAPRMPLVNAKGEGVLTVREEQVVNLVAEGMSNHDIAEQLSVKENTVKKSLLRIYDKVGVSNRVELVLYTITHRDDYHSHVPDEPLADSVQRLRAAGHEVPDSARRQSSRVCGAVA